MKTRQFFWLLNILFFVSFCWTSAGYAQDDDSEGIFTTFKEYFDGYLENSTAVHADDPDEFVKIKNTFELKYSKNFTDMLGITINTHAVYDAAYDVEDDLHVTDEDDYRAYLDLREAFVDLTFEKFDLRLGKQQVVWGKTDGFRVLDTVNPLDYREFILADLLDRRIPLWMAKFEYYFSIDYSLQLLAIPEMQFLELAKSGSEYEMNVFNIPSGVQAVVHDTEEPAENFKNTEYGVKFTGFHAGWDFTLNYLYSWDDEPTVKGSYDASTNTLTLSPEHERLHIIGASCANVFWDTVVRGEVAAKIGKYVNVEDLTDSDLVTKKTLLSYAVAFERDLYDISWLLQFLQETILDYDNVISDDETDTKITLQGTKDFRNDTLEVKISTIYGVNETEFLIRPSVEYDITDSTKITVGADIFEGGDDDTLFGQFDKKDRVYAEVRYSF